jgi:hypothetical protein
MKFKEKRRHEIGQNRGRMFILDGFVHLLGMLVFRALQVLKWFDFPVVSCFVSHFTGTPDIHCVCLKGF